MSVKDVFELSSLLNGDDIEKNELERKLVTLTSAIDQQELRVSDYLRAFVIFFYITAATT
jgi:hypothetical protein